MGRKVTSIWLSLIMIVGFVVIVDVSIDISLNVGGDTLYVNTTGSGGAYTNIQDAINDSIDGDTVFVYNGTYYENVVVNKTINLTGEDRDITIIDGSGSGDVIHVENDQVNISGFSIIGGGLAIWDSGIELYEVQDCRIYNNNISYNSCSAIYLHDSIRINISNNIMIENDIFINGISQNHWDTHSIDTSNTVNNKPVYYWKNRNSDIIPMGAGQIILVNCIDVTVENQELNDGSFPLKIAFSSNNHIENNTILYSQKFGMYIYNSSMNNIVGNDFSSNYMPGIYLLNSNNNNISDNILTDQSAGIHLEYSNYNNITNNDVSQNTNAMILYNSNNNNISGNNGQRSWNYNLGLRFSYNNSVIGNDFSLSKSSYGIKLEDSNDNFVQFNDASSNNKYGIYLSYSKRNNISLNDASSNIWYGIYLEYSDNNSIWGNDPVTDSNYGIYSYYSNNNNLFGNNASFNNFGIRLEYSNGNNITNNTAISNNNVAILLKYSNMNDITLNFLSKGYYGILSQSSSYNNISKNSMIENGIVLDGGTLEHWNTHNIYTSNTVNGKKVYYWKDIDGGIIPQNAGQVILANCSNITVQNQEITFTSRGISVGFSSKCSILSNIASNNDYGIMLYYSSGEIIGNVASNGYIGLNLYYTNGNATNNIINSNIHYGIHQYFSNGDIIGNYAMNNGRGYSIIHSDDNSIRNNLAFNNEYGIYLGSSYNNKIYHNDIIDNINQAYDDSNNGNQWDNDYPSGGNYWSDYNGLDLNSTPTQDVPPPDGIGDTMYAIDSNSQDNFPLMEPMENYTFLKPGWNLISIPLVQEKQNVRKSLEMIDGYYDAVQWFENSDIKDPWKHNHVSKIFGNDLSELNETMSFWIHITQPGDIIFTYNGTQPTSNQTIQLYEGWNMVGYPSLTSYNRTEGLNNLTFGQDVDLIQWYNASTKTWHDLEENDYFVPGRGYWIHTNAECEWEVPL